MFFFFICISKCESYSHYVWAAKNGSLRLKNYWSLAERQNVKLSTKSNVSVLGITIINNLKILLKSLRSLISIYSYDIRIGEGGGSGPHGFLVFRFLKLTYIKSPKLCLVLNIFTGLQIDVMVNIHWFERFLKELSELLIFLFLSVSSVL